MDWTPSSRKSSGEEHAAVVAETEVIAQLFVRQGEEGLAILEADALGDLRLVAR